MTPMGTIDIAAAAKLSGLPASTLRFYEEKGLIQSVGRQGLRRLFDTNVVEQLALITLGKLAGFSLEEIAEILSGGNSTIDRARLTAKADELNATIKRLSAMRDGLRHAAACSAPNHFECPKFQRMMGLALKRQDRKPVLGTHAHG